VPEHALEFGLDSFGEIGLVADSDSDSEAAAAYWPHWKATLDLAVAERGFPPPSVRQYEADIARGALFVGSPGYGCGQDRRQRQNPGS
jgi:hypothetical protein